MSVARRFAAALAVVGAGVLAYAVPASATGSEGGNGGGSCIENPSASDLEGDLDPQSGTAWVRGRDGRAVCADVLLSIYKVPDTWDGSGFNETAVPQQVIATAKATLKGTKKARLEVPVPNCGNVQIDLYLPPEITTVDRAGHGSQLIKGYLWTPGAENGHPKQCQPSPSPTTPSPTPTTPSPAPTSPSPTVTTPAPTTPAPTTTPVPTPSETVPVTPTPAPTSGLGAPIPVTPAPTSPAPPALAETGSDSTIPLIGLGGVLLVAGTGLSLAARKRRTA